MHAKAVPVPARRAVAVACRLARHSRHARLALLAAALGAGAGAEVAAQPVRVPADWFSCDSGKYALKLSRHYPSLHTIGRHRTLELEVRQLGGGVTATTRRLQYIGMRLDVLVLSSDPGRYTLLNAEVTSRRWHIGRLSVGTRPWPWMWSPEPSLAKVRLDGDLELVGAGDSALLRLRDGRVEKVSFVCRSGHAGA